MKEYENNTKIFSIDSKMVNTKKNIIVLNVISTGN